MNTSTIDNLQYFINKHNLKKPDGIVAFEAVVELEKEGAVLESIFTEVQVIQIKDMMVMYLLGLPFEESSMPDMYSTNEDYFFSLTAKCQLKIEAKKASPIFSVIVTPRNS